MPLKRTLATIFSYFETGDTPTQTQFEDSWFSMRHKDDPIATSEVTGLDAQLAAISAPTEETKSNGESIALADGEILDKLVITSASAQNIKIESGSGLEDVVPLTSFSAGEKMFFRADFLAVGAATLTVTCTSPITVKYFKQ